MAATISMTDIGGTGENNIHDAIKAVNATANLPLTFGGDSGKDVERKPGMKLNIVGGQRCSNFQTAISAL